MTAMEENESPRFTMRMCYDRTVFLQAALSQDEYRKKGNEVKKQLFRDVFPIEDRLAWQRDDARISAELEGFANDSVVDTDRIDPHVQDPDLIRAIDLEVFARQDPKFSALLELIDRRLARLPAGGFEAHEVELVRCCTCGSNCWRIDCNFLIRRKGQDKPFTIPIEVPTEEGKGVIPHILHVKVFVSASFTYSDEDYEKIFGDVVQASA